MAYNSALRKSLNKVVDWLTLLGLFIGIVGGALILMHLLFEFVTGR